MSTLLLILLLVLLLGGFGLAVEGLKWLLVIAVVLICVGLFTGSRGR